MWCIRYGISCSIYELWYSAVLTEFFPHIEKWAASIRVILLSYVKYFDLKFCLIHNIRFIVINYNLIIISMVYYIYYNFYRYLQLVSIFVSVFVLDCIENCTILLSPRLWTRSKWRLDPRVTCRLAECQWKGVIVEGWYSVSLARRAVSRLRSQPLPCFHSHPFCLDGSGFLLFTFFIGGGKARVSSHDGDR